MSSWKAAQDYIADAAQDILMLQETKASDIQIEGFRSKAKKKGYILKAHKAMGAAHARSAGVLVAWKRTLEVTPHPDMPSNERTVAVNIRTKATGSVTLATIYLPPGNPLAHDSTGSEVLHEVLSKATENGDRLVLGGDFNVSPVRMAEWLQEQGYPFKVLCHDGPTYVVSTGSSNIDYFIVSPELQAVMAKPQLVPLSCIKGHSPVLTGWSSQGLDRMVTVWRRPKRPDLLKASPEDHAGDDEEPPADDCQEHPADVESLDHAQVHPGRQGAWDHHRLSGFSQLLPRDGEEYCIT